MLGAPEVDVTVDAVRLSFETLLTTRDNSLRAEANSWLTQVFRASERAWELSMQLILADTGSLAGGPVTASDLQLFGAQILFQKLNDDMNQIFYNQPKCLEICRFLTTKCFDSPPVNNKPLRMRLSECLSVAAVSFLGAHWASAFADIVAAGRRRLQPDASPLSREECVNRVNLLHTLASFPELVSSIECKRYLMALVGHHTYTNWRKTKAGVYILSQIPTVSSVIGETLRLALNSMTFSESESLCREIIHEACLAATQWSRTFDCAILLGSDTLGDPALLWDLLLSDDLIPKDSAVAEMFAVNIPRLNVPSWQSAPLPTVISNPLSFELSTLGTFGRVLEPLLAFLFRRVLVSLVGVGSSNGSVPSTNDLDTHGGGPFVSFAFHWATVVYNIAVVAPYLLLFQSTTLRCCADTAQRSVDLPPNLLLQLLRADIHLHPQTHSRLLDLWRDIMDMRNDNIISSVHVRVILEELGNVTLMCMLSHSRRDNSVWDARNRSLCADPEGRLSYIEACQDAVVSLYYLYSGIGDEHSQAMLIQLTSIFESCCAGSDAAGAAACLVLLECVVETVIDLSADHFSRVLITICEKVPLDRECVLIVANLIKKQAVFFTEATHAPLWTQFFECLMRVMHVAPRICADGIFELCDAGGNLGLQQLPHPTDLIRNFYLFIEAQNTALPGRAAEFEATLFGALATLIRRLPAAEGAAVFVDSLSATTTAVEATLPLFSQVAASGDSSSYNSLVLLLRRVSRSIASLESKIAEVTLINMPEIRQLFVTRLLFGATGEQPHWRTYCAAASALLERRVFDPALQLAVPASDCYEGRPITEVDGSLYFALSDIAKALVAHKAEFSNTSVSAATTPLQELPACVIWIDIVEISAIPVQPSAKTAFLHIGTVLE